MDMTPTGKRGGNLLPPPNTMGLPEQFAQWRPGQEQAVMRALETDKRYIVMAMPTGFGKSLTYMTAGMAAGRFAVLTSTKGLQDQLMTDFNPCGLVDVRGMNNYVCFEDEEVNCDEGACHAGYKCELKGGGCLYFDAQRAAAISDLMVTNYAYWMGVKSNDKEDEDGGERKSALGKRDWLILDEAHDALDEIGGFLAVEIGYWEIEGVIGIRMERDEATMGEWKEWAGQAAGRTMQLLEQLRDRIKLGIDNTKRGLSRFRELKDLMGRLMVISNIRGEWVHEVTRDRFGRKVVKFDPVWPGEYAESALFHDISKIVLTSATIRPKTMELLSLRPEEYDFHEYPSSFPIENRPFIWSPTVRVRWDMDRGSARVWAAKIGSIVRANSAFKGIIHTVSYSRAKYLKDYADFGPVRAIYHDSGGMRSAVEEYRNSRLPAVLVSPSVGTGFDFPGDQCRYQIIGKMPFPDSRNKVMEARQKRDPDYFAYVAAQQLVQMAGRGVRSANDWCVTVIVDDNWGWFRNKYRAFLPNWFTQACRTSDKIAITRTFGGG